MKTKNSGRLRLPLLVTCALACAASGVRAQDAAAADRWQYGATLYLWGAGIGGETAAGSEVNVGFDTLIENLNMAFMGAFEARRAEWSLLADVVYLNVGANESARVPVGLAPGTTTTVDLDASVKTKGWVLNFIGGYNVWQAEQGSLDLIAGARYLDLELDFGLGLRAGPFARSREISASGDVWDAVAGVKGHITLNEKWFLPYYLDVGAGQSDLTWQASAGLAYRLGWGDVSLSYRHMEWDFESGSRLDTIDFSGPLLAAKFRF